MWTLIGIGIYLVINLAVGLWVARRIKSVEDYLLAGRNLPLYLVTGMMFATWFGSETILGVSAEVAKEGFIGAVEDPLGASLCLFLIGIFLAPKLLRLKLLTFGDLYRIKFGKTGERIAALFLIASYLGWVAAQFVALGLISEITLGFPRDLGIWIGFGVVLIYTFAGGMWSIAVLDFFHNIVIVAALLVIGYFIYDRIDINYVKQTLPDGYFRIYPSQITPLSILNYLSAWIVIGLGSLPQQDVFQRVMSSDSERTAVRSAYIGGILYLTIGLLPLLIATYVRVYHPELLTDPQATVPLFILQKMPPWVGFLFVGALISAVLNCASAAILAPAGILSENIIRPLFPKQSQSALLWTSRIGVVLIACVSLVFAFSKSDIHSLVEQSSALSLVSLFVPMMAALYLKRLSPAQGNSSMICGMIIWLIALMMETKVNPLLYGLGASAITFMTVRLYELRIKS